MSIIYGIIAIIFCLTVHEYAHAWVADKLGDPTARLLGRLSLNPMRHFDLVGTLCLIFFKIGWGKPVPFNPHNLKYPRRDSALISLAGPLTNLLTAIILALPLKWMSESSLAVQPIFDLVSAIFIMSVLIFSLNVLPFPPFDGAKIIGVFVPRRYLHLYESYLTDGMRYVIIFILFDLIVIEELFHFSILDRVVTRVATWVIALISIGT